MGFIMYYEINENAARAAHMANSMRPWQEGQATAEYQAEVDAAREIADQQKQAVDLCYHDKIDYLLDLYSKKLAENYNQSFAIDARMPSILIAGGGNFDVRKKEKQNAARATNAERYEKISGLIDKIKAVGTGGTRSSEPGALEALKAKLSALEQEHERMKVVNAYYRKHKTLDGCNDLDPNENRPASACLLSNNLANIKRLKKRIAEVEQLAACPVQGWTFNGGEVVANTEADRLQLLFADSPSEELRTRLKKRGFRWSPRFKAWQRQLTANAVSAAKEVLA